MTKTDSNTIDARQDSVYKFVSPNYKTRISKKSLTPFSTTNTNKQLYNKSAANESQLPQMSSVNK